MPRSVTPDDWQQLAPMIDRVLDATIEQREALLDELSAGDAARRAELVRLVEECERPDPLLDRPVAEAFAGLIADEGIPVPETLAVHYRIVRELGRGGMAVVYQAHDAKHDRDVAVKVLRPELAAAVGRERFLREITIAAQLRHPGIVPLYDSGESDGLLFYVMPCESGPSLRERLERDGPLPLDEAVPILRDVCEALAHAHQHGIVHRDIKPDNVLLAGRRALVTDFGVAKAITDANTASPRTTAGAAMGTPAYMAPEQIGAGAPVDHRADIYALGLLAYEVLASRPPFTGETAHEVLTAHLADLPEPLAQRRPGLPPALVDLVMKCLEKRPEQRWQQASEVLAQLDRVIAGATDVVPEQGRRKTGRGWKTVVTAGLLSLALFGLAWRLTRERPAREPSARELFIVADVSSPAGDSSWGPVVAQAIRDELAATPRLASLSAEMISAARRRMRLAPDAPLSAGVARELAVREEVKMVVESSYRPAGAGLTFAARIVEAASGNVVHASTATARSAAEIPAAIQQLARGLRQGLGEPLAPIESPTGALWSYTTRSLPALQKFQLAIASRAAGDYLRAIELDREALALDPDFAMAHVALASNTALAGLATGPVIPGLVRARRLADSLPERERRAVEAFYHWHVTGDLAKSIAAFLGHIDALRDFPREAGFIGEAATALQLNGEGALAERLVREVKRSMEQSGGNYPGGRSSGGVQLSLVQVLHAEGKDTEAAGILDAYAGRRPENTRALQFRIGFLVDSGRYDSAHTLAARLRRQSGLRNDLRLQAELDAVHGRFSEAMGHLRDLRDQASALGEIGVAVEIAAAAGRLRLLAGDGAAISEVDDFIQDHSLESLDVLARPYLPLALFYARAGAPDRAATWLRRYQREVPAEFQGPDRWMLHRTRAAMYAAEGSPERALAELREASRLPALRTGLFEEPSIRVNDHPELGRLYQRLGRPDSALAVYGRYFAARSLSRLTADAFERAPTLEALATLLEQRGDRGLAASTYEDFAALWAEADTGLQPRVEAARRRVTALATD